MTHLVVRAEFIPTERFPRGEFQQLRVVARCVSKEAAEAAARLLGDDVSVIPAGGDAWEMT